MLFNYELKKFNFRLVFYILLLNLLGLMLIRSAANHDTDIVTKQIIGVLVGFGLVAAVAMIDYHRWISMYVLVYVVCVGMLVSVLFFGKTVNNATRWIVLPIIGQIQPSEFVKIGAILFFAWLFSSQIERINHISTLIISIVLFSVLFLLIFSQPDLSTGIVLSFIFVSMIFVAGISYRWVFGVLGTLIPLAVGFIYLLQHNMVPLLKDYQARRILAFIDREKYAEVNLQQDNSIMAIGSGMLSGKGLNNNTLASVKNGNFLSEEQTDFIFAVVGEELGFIGCIIVLILISLVVVECLWLASRAPDLSGRLICTGMASLIAFQSFCNIAVATGVFPNTGLPLPFVSYGVSSLISIYIGIGICLNVGLQRGTSNN